MIRSYLISAASYAIFFLLIYFVIKFIYKKKKKETLNIKHEIAIGIFLAYLVGLLSQTILPLWQCGFINGEFYLQFNRYGNDSINLIPFKTIYTYLFTEQDMAAWKNVCQLNILANIGLFLPFGFLLPFIKKKNTAYKIILTGMFMSVFIEVMQIFIGRSSDIDDVILNTLGTTFGYLCYRIMVKICNRKQSRQVA